MKTLSIPVLLILAWVLGGCAEYAYRTNELIGLNCRPEALQHGRCVAAKRGSQ